MDKTRDPQYNKNMTKNSKFLVISVIYVKQFLWIHIGLDLLLTKQIGLFNSLLNNSPGICD